MADNAHPRFTLIGSGLSGALLAAYLGRSGYEVDLYERREDPNAGNFVGGRSINLALSTRGIAALERVGIAKDVLAAAIPMRGRMIHGPRGDLHYQPYDKDPSRYINSIGRAALNSATIAAAQKHANVRVHFNHRCTEVDLDRPAARLIKTTTNEHVEAASDIIIGVDGAFSAVRRSMQRLDRFDYWQDYLRHGYKELTIPPTSTGGFALEKNALHIWPRHSFMMIALPNPDASFTCTLFYPFEGPASFAALKTDDDVRRLFEREFADAVPLMPTLLDDFNGNPTGAMMTVRCGPWHHGGKVALLGDAAHAVVPFYGQGANASFEDCIILDECIAAHAPNWERVFAEYSRIRKPDCDALATLAVENFYEMRDKTASRAFRWRKKFERSLHTLLPDSFTPLYTMVSFTRTPYAQAVRKARRQDMVVAIVAALWMVVVPAAILAWQGTMKPPQALTLMATIVYSAVMVMYARSVVRKRQREK
jgi:kynurenine 3-monooxygenase